MVVGVAGVTVAVDVGGGVACGVFVGTTVVGSAPLELPQPNNRSMIDAAATSAVNLAEIFALNCNQTFRDRLAAPGGTGPPVQHSINVPMQLR